METVTVIYRQHEESIIRNRDLVQVLEIEDLLNKLLLESKTKKRIKND